jgi:hypothetical protein
VTYVIMCQGFPTPLVPCPYAGQYLEWFDPKADPDEGEIGGFTPDIAKAKRFEKMIDATSFYMSPRVDAAGNPVMRADGKPDRPLTAFTVSIEPLPEEIAR